MMKRFSKLLKMARLFEKKAQQSPYDNPDDPYDDPLGSGEAKGEVMRINKLISQVKNNLHVFLDAVRDSDEEEVYGEPSDKAEALKRKKKMSYLITKLSAVGRQWTRDMNTTGISYKASEKYTATMESLISQIKMIPSPRGDEHKGMLESLTSALMDFNPAMMHGAPKPKAVPTQQYQKYTDTPAPNYSFYGGKSGE